MIALQICGVLWIIQVHLIFIFFVVSLLNEIEI